jgi:hypothetical protein
MKFQIVLLFSLVTLHATSQNATQYNKSNAKYYGKYATKGLIVQVTQSDSSLVLAMPGAPFQLLIPVADNKFKTVTFGEEIFVFEERNGKVDQMISQRKGGSLKLRKISDTPDNFNIGDSLLPLRKTTEHFIFFYSEVDSDDIDALASRLETDYVKIVSDLKVANLPNTSVRIYSDLQSFHRGINFPDAPANILATAFGKNDFRMVSPKTAGADSLFIYKGMSHEFTHCVHLNIDYSPNNPRWLWEGVAMYEADWFLDPKELSYITSKKFPRLASLGNGMEYELGFVIIEAIRELWGFDTVIGLIKTRGDSNKVLQLSEKEFEKEIFSHIYSKYIRKE